MPLQTPEVTEGDIYESTGLFCGSPKVLFIHTKLQTNDVLERLRILQLKPTVLLLSL
jgi:hypothetical protein